MIFSLHTNLVKTFLLERKRITIGIIVLGVISNLLTIIIPVSIGKYYELVFHLNARRAKVLSFIPETLWNTVPKFLLFFIGLVTLRYFFFFLHQFLLKKEGEIFVKEIKDYLFKHQLKIKYDIYKEKGIGKYLLRYTGDINSLKNLYLKGSIRVVIDIIMILIALLWLYLLNPKGALVIVALSLVAYLIIRMLNKKVEFYSLEKRNKTSGQLSFVSRTLNSILSVIILNKQEIEHKKYRIKSNAVKDTAIIYDKWFVINKGFIAFTQYAILCAVLYVFYIDTKNGTETHGSDLISFILLYITILPVLRRLFSLETVYKLGNISLTKLNNIIQIEKEEIQKGNTLRINNPRVQFDNVRFNDHLPIHFTSKKMTGTSLLLPKGVTPLNIINALTRIDDQYNGIININNINILNYSPKSLRANIAVVSNQIPLIGRSVYEAITFSRSKKTKDKITEQFLSIQSQFINVTPLVIDEKIGENGSKLSATHYELLCFIRGMICNKKILIVDEFPLLEILNESAIQFVIEKQKATIIKITTK